MEIDNGKGMASSRDVRSEELSDVLCIASGAMPIDWDASMMQIEDLTCCLECPEACIWQENAIGRSVIGQMVNSVRIGGEWLRVNCGAEKKKKESCCAIHAASRVTYPELATEEEISQALVDAIIMAPKCDAGRAVGKEAKELVGSLASSRTLTNEDRKQWLIRAIGMKVAGREAFDKKENMVKKLKEVAANPGILKNNPPRIWGPLHALVGSIFKLNADVDTYVRRARRLYIALVDGEEYVSHRDGSTHFFRPSLTARFAILRNENLRRAPGLNLFTHSFFSCPDQFEQFEAAIELRCLQDKCIAESVMEQRENKAQIVCQNRPLKAFGLNEVLTTHLYPAFRVDIQEKSSFIQALFSLAADSTVARCAVYALECLETIFPITDAMSKEGYDPFQFLNAAAILSQVAMRGIWNEYIVKKLELTLEARISKPEDKELVLLALRRLTNSSLTPPSVRGKAARRISIILGESKSYAERLDFLLSIIHQDDQAISRQNFHHVLESDDRLELEKNVRQLYDTQKANGLHLLVGDESTRIALEYKRENSRIPIEVYTGGNNPLACRAGYHSKLLVDDENNDGSPLISVSVEEHSLNYYRDQKYWGSHCEGSLMVPLLRILLADALLAPLGFLSPFAIEPIDLYTPFFAVRRKKLISTITKRIRSANNNKALADLISSAYSEACDDLIFCISRVGAPLYLLQAIGLGLGSESLAALVQAYADNGCNRGGLPDLLIIRAKSNDYIHPDAFLSWLADGTPTPPTTKPSKADAGLLACLLAADDASDAFSFTSAKKKGHLDKEQSEDEKRLREVEEAERETARLAQPMHPSAVEYTFDLRLIEVKSQNDQLQDHQRVWLKRLLDADIDAAVLRLPNSKAYQKNKRSEQKRLKQSRKKTRRDLADSPSASSRSSSVYNDDDDVQRTPDIKREGEASKTIVIYDEGEVVSTARRQNQPRPPPQREVIVIDDDSFG